MWPLVGYRVLGLWGYRFRVQRLGLGVLGLDLWGLRVLRFRN